MAKRDMDIRASDISLNVDLPSNSKMPKTQKVKEAEEKLDKENHKVEPVIKEGAVIKKRGLGSKLAKAFVADDADHVGSYILNEVIIPSVKDIITSIVKNGIDLIFYGGSTPRSNRLYRDRGNTYVNYTGYSDNYRRKDYTKSDRTAHNFDKIEFYDTEGETGKEKAEIVLDGLLDCLDRYPEVTVATFYDLANVESYYTDRNYGWKNLNGASVKRVGRGVWTLDLPKPIPLD